MNPRRIRGQHVQRCSSLALIFVLVVLQLFAALPAAAQQLVDENGNPVYYDPYGNPLYGYDGTRVYYHDWDAESCPRRVVLAFNGERYTASPYAGYANRGADAYLGKVFYTFNNLPSLDRKWVASGNFYLYGWECRLTTYVNPSGALMPPHSRLEYTESPVSVACSGGSGGGGVGDLGVVVDIAYDPYASGDGDCGGGGDPGGGGGSGTPYNPGDYTGGQTVDWGSGTGNGGSSACGAAAVVEYVCIDTWHEGIGWVEWGCGYVTTC